MTESFRPSGEYPEHGTAPQQPAYSAGTYSESAYPPPPSYEPEQPLPVAPRKRKKLRGPVGLLAAVAVAAGAVGGGTAYAFQELSGQDTTTASSAGSTPVVPSSQRGTVSGVATAV